MYERASGIRFKKELFSVHPNRVCLIVLLFVTLSSARDKQKDAETLLKRAQEATDIRSDTSKPFRLRAQFHFAGELSSERAEVEYKETWRSPEHWRHEISSLDYQQIEVGGKDRRWVLRDLATEPARIRYIREWAEVPVFEIGKVSRVEEQPGQGGPRDCIISHLDIIPHLAGIKRTLCFDRTTGVLARREISTDSAEMSCDYYDYQKFGSKTYPRKLRCDDSLGFTIDGVVTDLSEDDATVDTTQFVPPTGATEWPVCNSLRPPQWLHFWGPTPWNLRAPLARGVGVSFAVGVDGKPVNIGIVKSLGKHHDAGAMGIVRGWEFKPATCAGVSIPYTFEMVFW